MFKFILYCDLNTLRCTSEDINKELRAFSGKFLQVNTSLWIFTYPNEYQGYQITHEEHIFLEYFEKYTDTESIIVITEVSNTVRFFGELPQVALDLLGLGSA